MKRTVMEYIRAKAISCLGLIDTPINPISQEERMTFINNIDEVQVQKLREYNVWYSGDSDEIMNFYTRSNAIDYPAEAIYSRNKLSYFWCVTSTEKDVKRTHSGQPRNIVDTLVNLIGLPQVRANTDPVQKRLKQILDDNNFNNMFMQEQLPFTLVEGWGCYKINYDKNLRDTPILLYYRADSVDFIYRSNQLIAIVFRDYYYDDKDNTYVLFETRRLAKHEGVLSLIIEKELFKMTRSDVIIPCDLKNIPQLSDIKPKLVLKGYKHLLAEPTIIYKDNFGDNPGRSIFTGKIDLFDDLDQCLSQASNTVRRSTPIEVFNSNYLERDEITMLPKQPHCFDRKYVLFEGGVDANGSTSGQDAVTVTQPALNTDQYNQQSINILLECISGIMSPATLGIDIAKKDNAEAQREKEKVTIFTRNTIIAEETKILNHICQELLCAWELMNKGEITVQHYDGINIKFDEFADASFEKTSEVLTGLFNSGLMSPELLVDLLYKDTLPPDIKERELKYIKEQQQASQSPMPGAAQGGIDPAVLGQMGAELGGNNNNPYNKGQADLDTLAQEFAQ